MKSALVVSILCTSLAGCDVVPAYTAAPDNGRYSASIWQIAHVMANIKCELWYAANNTDELPAFEDDPQLRREQTDKVEEGRKFTLHNIFQAIEYVGEVDLKLEATNTIGTNPSAKFPDLGATIHPLSVGLDANLSEKGHRENTTYHSVDFERLVEGTEQKPAKPPSRPCGSGRELESHLGLDETLKMSFVASSMNDISVWPGGASNPGATRTADDQYTGGKIHAVIDFTTDASANGGPIWSLKHFIGPSGNNGLLGASRQSINQLTVTFIPVCIRNRYSGVKKNGRWDYSPTLPHGTPAWANYLPPCLIGGTAVDKRRALDTAHDMNIRLNDVRVNTF